MAFRQWPDSIAAVICDGAPYEIDLGTAQPTEIQQLEVFGLQIFKQGLQPLVRLRVHAYNVSNVLIGTSEDIVVGLQIEDAYPETDNFYGWVRFTFDPRINLPSGATTRFKLELVNYTYTDAIWMAAIKDWPVAMGYNTTPGSASSAPFAIELYGAS